jgi:hypothetical protein
MWAMKFRHSLFGAAILTVVMALGVAGALPATAETQPSTGDPMINAAPSGFHTVCSLQPDPQSDCMAVGFGLGRGRVVAGAATFDWFFVSAGGNAYTIHHRPHPNYCLDIQTDSRAVDAPMNLRPCDGTLSQRWLYREDISGGPAGSYHPLQNDWSKLFLSFETVPGGPFGPDPIVQRLFGDRNSQYFGLLAPAA